MKKLWIAATLAAGLAIGSLASVQAKLPPAPAKSDADKAAEAEKAKAGAAKEAAELDKARDKAVANYKKNKGIVEPKASPATTSGKKK
jgi:phosphoenolpyruvate-protein kinase (PTS system EI component)